MGKLTIREIETLPDKAWRSDGPAGTTGTGTLVFRREGAAIHSYFRYAIGRTTKVFRIGLFDKTGRRGSTLAELRDRAAELAKLRQDGAVDLDQHFAAIKEAKRQEAEAARVAREAQEAARQREEEARQRFTLATLADAYHDHLVAKGKTKTAYQAKLTFKLHLCDPFPDLCAKPARDVTALELAAVIRTATQAGKVRTGGVLRSMLHAAFTLAMKAPLSADIGPRFLGFEIDRNPVTAIPTIATRTRERTLNDQELGHYLHTLLTGRHTISDLFLMLHLLSAGQRVLQLLRVTEADWDPMSGSLRLDDPKGRRTTPRVHLVPLATQGATLVGFLFERLILLHGTSATPRPLFLSDDRKGAILNNYSCGARSREIAQQIGVSFAPGDIRRTCETRLASLGVSRDVRAQLLSHGLGDLQTRAYDRHSWTNEKREALSNWETHLEEVYSRYLRELAEVDKQR